MTPNELQAFLDAGKVNYLRAIRIRHWLDLIAESYPELKPLIEGHIEGQPLS